MTGRLFELAAAREDPAQLVRGEEFRRAHPGTAFTPVAGQVLAWVPFGSGGVQFSGESLGKALDEAEKFFRQAAPDPDG